jgi:hypothetical protein
MHIGLYFLGFELHMQVHHRPIRTRILRIGTENLPRYIQYKTKVHTGKCIRCGPWIEKLIQLDCKGPGPGLADGELYREICL